MMDSTVNLAGLARGPLQLNWSIGSGLAMDTPGKLDYPLFREEIFYKRNKQ